MEASEYYRGGGEPFAPGTAGNGHGAQPHPHVPRRSIARLFADLGAQMQTLLRLEVQLAKTELTEQVAKAGKGAGLMAAAGALAYAGLLALVASLGFLLASFMPTWLGFAVAALVVLLVAAILFAAGQSAMKKADFDLNRTSRTLEEDALWMRQEAAEVKRDPNHLGSRRAVE